MCSGGFWTMTGGGAIYGGACSVAGSTSGTLYCNGSTWETPYWGGPCTGSAGVMNMVCNGTQWTTPTYGTPGIPNLAFPTIHNTPPVNGMYDAFEVDVSIPASYKNIGYMYNLGGANSFEIALNNTATTLLDMYGALSSFQAPSVGGASSVNVIQLDQGTAVPFDMGSDPMTGMSWGRWQGGNVNLTVLPGTATPTAQTGSLHWFSTGMQTQAVTLPVTGTWNYALIGNTSPTDNTGVVGTLNNATFNANFSTQTVNVGVSVSMPASSASSAMPVTLNANTSNGSILAGGNFKTVIPTVSCTGSGCFSPTGSGVIGGQFSAPTGQGVGVGYGLVNGGQTVNGTAVFKQQ